MKMKLSRSSDDVLRGDVPATNVSCLWEDVGVEAEMDEVMGYDHLVLRLTSRMQCISLHMTCEQFAKLADVVRYYLQDLELKAAKD